MHTLLYIAVVDMLQINIKALSQLAKKKNHSHMSVYTVFVYTKEILE